MNFVGDAGVLDFDDDLLAREEPGQVDLGDGGRGQRRILELREQAAQRFAELGFDRGPDRVGRIGRGAGLQVGQFPGDLGADQVGPRAEHLAELNEGSAELGEGQARAFLDFQVRDRLAVNALDSILDPPVIQALDPIGQAVLGQHADDFTGPVDVTFQPCQCGKFHSCSNPSPGLRLRRGARRSGWPIPYG